MKYYLTFLVAAIFTVSAYSQDTNLILGKTDKFTSAAVFDLSDPSGVNIEVNLWGFVRLPGRYRVPYYTTFMDLMSYSGGPTENTRLEDMRIVRTDSTGKTRIIRLNYGDLLWEDEIKVTGRENPVLKSGDVVIVPEEKRFTFRDNLQFYMPIITGLLSIATFIITVSKK
jgi:hypothetical protein